MDHKEIIEKLYELKKEAPKGEIKSNAGGYHTGSLEGIDVMQPLIKKVGSHLEAAVSLDFTKSDCKLQMWGMINKKGTYNHEHSHEKAGRAKLPSFLIRGEPRKKFIISGVYYLQIPDNSGRIVFVDNRKQEIPCTPEERLLLFFPANFRHYVEENESDVDRISISFNIIGVDRKYIP